MTRFKRGSVVAISMSDGSVFRLRPRCSKFSILNIVFDYSCLGIQNTALFEEMEEIHDLLQLGIRVPL